MQCPHCSTELPDDARFCGACGKGIGDSAANRAAPAAAPASSEPDPFALVPADFGRALIKACERADLPLPAEPLPTDHLSLKAAGEALGLSKLAIEQALHRVSMEKLPAEERRALGVVLDDEVAPTGRSMWLPVVVAINVVAVSIAVIAFLSRDSTPRPEIVLAPQSGELDVEALNGALEPVTEAAQACYLDALKRNDKLLGEVVLTLRIGLDGQAGVELKSKTLDDAAALACIEAAARAGAYPAARIAPVDVDVPFVFTPTSG